MGRISRGMAAGVPRLNQVARRNGEPAVIKAGTRVRIASIPPWVEQLPEESQRVFRFCLGRTYSVEEIDHNGLAVVDVSADIDQRFGGFGNDIRLEPAFLEELASEG